MVIMVLVSVPGCTTEENFYSSEYWGFQSLCFQHLETGKTLEIFSHINISSPREAHCILDLNFNIAHELEKAGWQCIIKKDLAFVTTYKLILSYERFKPYNAFEIIPDPLPTLNMEMELVWGTNKKSVRKLFKYEDTASKTEKPKNIAKVMGLLSSLVGAEPLVRYPINTAAAH